MFGLALLLGFTAIVWLQVVSKREPEVPHDAEPIDFTDWSDWEWEDAS